MALKNIQGDIWLVFLPNPVWLAGVSADNFSLPRPGLPKRFQQFLFFQIHKPAEFKARLKSFIDDKKITTAEDACGMKQKIAAEKGKTKSTDGKASFLPLPGINIAFASTGLHKVSNTFQSSRHSHRCI